MWKFQMEINIKYISTKTEGDRKSENLYENLKSPYIRIVTC